MKSPRSVISLAMFSAVSPSLAVPETLELTDGRVLEKVTAAVVEEGKVKVTHSGGVMRIAPADLSRGSLSALGLSGSGSGGASCGGAAIDRPETPDGKVYEGIRNLRVKPSFISFTARPL